MSTQCRLCLQPVTIRNGRVTFAHTSWCRRAPRPHHDRTTVTTPTPDVTPLSGAELDQEDDDQ